MVYTAENLLIKTMLFLTFSLRKPDELAISAKLEQFSTLALLVLGVIFTPSFILK